MRKGFLQRGLAIALSAAMLLTGISVPELTAKAEGEDTGMTEKVVYSDNMNKTTEEEGWTVTWENDEGVTSSRKVDSGSVNNKTMAWNLYSPSAQKLTLTKEVTQGVTPGNYQLFWQLNGGSVNSYKVSLYEGETEKSSKTFSSINGWDVWETSATDMAVIAGNTIKIVFEIDIAAGGWLWFDNLELKTGLSAEAAKEEKLAELDALLIPCKALKAEDYEADSFQALQDAITAAEAVKADAENKTIEEINSAIIALQAAKDALVSATIVENAGVNVKKVENITDDFIRGVDISTYKSLIDSGVKFKGWEGEELDDAGFFTLLKNAGVNYVRIRVWNHPYADEAKTQGYGAGNCDVDKAKWMGKLASDAGLKVLVDFHYSDFWADPAKQKAPKAWKDYTVDQKKTAIATYTEESLNTLIEAGVDVGMVQVGNETTSGICGEKSWDNMATLFKAGCDAVHKVATEKSIEIMAAIHFTNPDKTSTMKGFADSLNESGVEYDVFASSYYPYWHGTRENLTSVLKYVADTYNKKVMVAETSWARTMEDGDGQPNVVRPGQNDDTSQYPATYQGQANEVRDVIQAVANVGTKGIGVMYWEPAWLPVNVYKADAENAADVLAANKLAWETYGSGWASSYSVAYDDTATEESYGGSEWDNQAMFDFEGNPLPSLNVYKYVLTGATEPKRLDAIDGCEIDAKEGDDIASKLPTTVTGIYNDSTKAEGLSVVWNQADIAAITSFGTHKVNGTVTWEGSEETMNAVCTVHYFPQNLLIQGDFEGEGGGRDVWEIIGSGLNDKLGENPRSGKQCLAFYHAEAYELTATQSFTVETPGKYKAFMYLQGGDAENAVTAKIKLSNDTKETFTEDAAGVKGWLVWQNPTVDEVQAQIGDVLTVTITITGKAGSWGSVDDVYLYQTVKDPVYDVTYHLDGGTNSAANPEKIDGSKEITLSNPTKTGYIFEGWYTESGFENKVEKIAAGATANVTLYAKWRERTDEDPEVYTITYHLDGGTNAAVNPSEYDGTEAITLAAPSREGYVFEGWYTDSEFETAITEIAAGTTGNLNLYAKWKKQSGEGPGEEGIKVSAITLSAKTTTMLRGKTFTLTAQIAPESATVKTLKWESSNEKVARVNDEGVVTTVGPGQATITATATDGSSVKGTCIVTVPYHVSYVLNGGTNNRTNPVSYFNQKINLKNPTRSKYSFSGWYTDSRFKNKVTGITQANKSDLTLYAKWSKVTVKKASVKTVKNNAKKKAKVTIKKVSGAKGYRIQYSTSKKFKKGTKTKTTTKTSYTLSGLKKGKTYYVRVCAYKLDSKNSKIYGKYSSVKKIKIKK